MTIHGLTAAEQKLLVKLYKVQKTSRKAYTHIQPLKAIPNCKSIIKSLKRKELVFTRKAEGVVGLTKPEGLAVAYKILRERGELE